MIFSLLNFLKGQYSFLEVWLYDLPEASLLWNLVFPICGNGEQSRDIRTNSISVLYHLLLHADHIYAQFSLWRFWLSYFFGNGFKRSILRVFVFFLPQSLAAGGGNVVVLTAGVNGRLDFGLTALQGKTDGAQRDFSLSPQRAVTTAH